MASSSGLSKRSRKELHTLCVSGYIRRHCRMHVPQDLRELCSLMSMKVIDEWNKEMSDSEFIYSQSPLTDNHICKINPRVVGWRNAFASISVEGGESHEWKLRIVNEPRYQTNILKREVMIGISNRKNSHSGLINSYFCDAAVYKDDVGYGYYAYDGNVFFNCATEKGEKEKKYGQPFAKDDVITMTLDLTGQKGTLSYKVNDKEQGIAFNNINVNDSYRLALACFYEQEVEIINSN